jgi:hypothetical protein
MKLIEIIKGVDAILAPFWWYFALIAIYFMWRDTRRGA